MNVNKIAGMKLVNKKKKRQNLFGVYKKFISVKLLEKSLAKVKRKR